MTTGSKNQQISRVRFNVSSIPDEVPRKWIRAKDILWFLYLYPLRSLAALLPVRIIIFIRGLFVPVIQFTTRNQQKKMKKRLDSLRPVYFSGLDSDTTVNDYIKGAVYRTIDDLIMDKLIDKKLVKNFSLLGKEYLEQALTARKGIILITGHFRANRLAKRMMFDIGFPIMSLRNTTSRDNGMGYVGKKYLQPRYFSFLHKVIRDEVLLQDPDCILKILKRLRSGGIVDIHIDVPLTGETSRFKFLDDYREFPMNFIRIAQIAGCPLLPMLNLGNSDDLTIIFEKPIDTIGKDRLVILNGLVSLLEKQIVSYPEQWDLWTRSGIL